MPTLCRAVAEGGVGFDYRLAMAIPGEPSACSRQLFVYAHVTAVLVTDMQQCTGVSSYLAHLHHCVSTLQSVSCSNC